MTVYLDQGICMTEYAQKTPLQIANEVSVRVPYEYPPRKGKILHRKRMRGRLYTRKPLVDFLRKQTSPAIVFRKFS